MQARPPRHEPLAARRDRGEQLAQVALPICAVMRREGAPGRALESTRTAHAACAPAQLRASCRAGRRGGRPTTSTNDAPPSFCSCVAERVDVDAVARERGDHGFGVAAIDRHRRADRPWSAKASSVFSGIVLTVSGAASAST